jgi:pyrroline-5-carboxylate reductase
MPSVRLAAVREPRAVERIGYDAQRNSCGSGSVGGNKHILLIGFGNMGRALARGWLAQGHAPGAIAVVEADAAARASAVQHGLRASERVADALTGAHRGIVVLAVKPSQLGTVLADCAAHVAPGTVFLSIAAGKTLAQLGAALKPDAAVVRARPNTPAAIGKGMTVLVANAAVTQEQRSQCGELAGAVGEVAWLDDERHMDAVTAVSGSGPAYVFLLIECLERAALEMGLESGLAKQLALATVAGAGAYAATAGEEPDALRRRVTSPGGTTQAALEVLQGERGLQELLSRAVSAAAARSRELSAV